MKILPTIGFVMTGILNEVENNSIEFYSLDEVFVGRATTSPWVFNLRSGETSIWYSVEVE